MGAKIISLFLAIIFSCCGAKALELQNGDLLFQVEGKSQFSKAISASTGDTCNLNFVHVAILKVTPEKRITVIEASPEEGVREIDLEKFLESAPKINGQPGIVVKRVNTEIMLDSAINRALSHIGEPYDWYYLPDNGKLYCSELIYDTYLDVNGNKIFHTQPMRFRDENGEMPEFWTNLYENLGVGVPEGIPGTNPNDMSRESCLEEIVRFFTYP